MHIAVAVEDQGFWGELDDAARSWVKRDTVALTALRVVEDRNDVQQGEVLARLKSYLGKHFTRYIYHNFAISQSTIERRIRAYHASLEAPAEDDTVADEPEDSPRRIHVIEAARSVILRSSYNYAHKDLLRLSTRDRKKMCLELCAYLLNDAGIHAETTITPIAAPDELLIRRGRPVKLAA